MLTGHGLKGAGLYDWAWTDIQSDDAPDPEDTEGDTFILVVRQRRFTGGLSFYRRHSTRPVTLAGLVHIVCTRWRVEEDFQLV
ncbi:hypothetical protein ACH4TV_46880 [Streptomyces sp. NPDC020898]|uniref:hypothetical protein n=1 Tax=Streptomyces sp. NPDC020898 TaxID=3365101 RepID=UPI0037BD41E3